MSQIGSILFCLFLLVAAAQDLGKKSVEVRVYLVFGAAAVVWNGIEGIGMSKPLGTAVMAGTQSFAEAVGKIHVQGVIREPAMASVPELVRDLCLRRILSSSIGILLLLIGKASRGSIGAGDGCFFLVSGLLLDPCPNLWLFSVSVFLCGVYSLGLFVRARFTGESRIGKETLAFLPFVAVAGAAGIAAGVIR